MNHLVFGMFATYVYIVGGKFWKIAYAACEPGAAPQDCIPPLQPAGSPLMLYLFVDADGAERSSPEYFWREAEKEGGRVVREPGQRLHGHAAPHRGPNRAVRLRGSDIHVVRKGMPAGRTGRKWMLGQVSVMLSTLGTAASAAAPIWYSVICTLGEYTPPLAGPKKAPQSAACREAKAASQSAGACVYSHEAVMEVASIRSRVSGRVVSSSRRKPS